MFKKLSEKLRAKFPATTPGCFMLKIARLDDAFSEVFFTASNPTRRSITAAKRGEKVKRKGEKTFPKKNFCACPSPNALKRDASGKKGKLLCCKHTFDRIKGNLVEIQPKNHQNVQKTHFLQKVPAVNAWVNVLYSSQ